MTEFLVDIGGMYLVLSGGALLFLVADWVRQTPGRREPVGLDAVIKVLGMVGMVIWFLIGFGIASWLVSLPFAWMMPR